jgi:RND family efflux transporter MFP subunit
MKPSAGITIRKLWRFSGDRFPLFVSTHLREAGAGEESHAMKFIAGRALVLGLGVTLAFCVTTSGCTPAPAQPPGMPPSKVTVSAPIEKEVTDYADFTGLTMAVGTVEIRARVWGYLDKVAFKEGGLVKKGDLLFQIDPRPYEAAVQQSRGKVAQDKAQLKHTKATYERILKLRQSVLQAATQEDLDKALADRDTADATLQADEGMLKQNELDLKFTRVAAPISGRVSRAEVTEGNVVQSGQNGGTLLTTLVSVDPMYVYFDVDERTLLQVRRMMLEDGVKSTDDTSLPMYVGLADEDDFPHVGTLNFMDNRVDSSTGTLRLRAIFPNPDGFLTPGLFVRCRLPIGTPKRRLLVAEQALGSDQGQKFLYVINANNEATYRPVKAGKLYGSLRVIESGLSPGEKVVVNGLQRVRPGETVELETVPMPAPQSAALQTATQPVQPVRHNKRVAGN